MQCVLHICTISKNHKSDRSAWCWWHCPLPGSEGTARSLHFARVTFHIICQMFDLSVTRSSVVQRRFFQITSCWLVQSQVSKQANSAKWTTHLSITVSAFCTNTWLAFCLVSSTRSFAGIIPQRIQTLMLTSWYRHWRCPGAQDHPDT